jgi:hypothetical protein
MTATTQVADPQAHPLAPWVTLSWLQRLQAVKAYHTGAERIRDVSGPVALVKLGPRRITPVVAMVTSPQGTVALRRRASSPCPKAGSKVLADVREP